jgi:hypothetical protein
VPPLTGLRSYLRPPNPILFGFVLVDLVRFELTTSSMPWKIRPFAYKSSH